MYKYILFDLDGTITDSSKGITNCVKYALEARVPAIMIRMLSIA